MKNSDFPWNNWQEATRLDPNLVSAFAGHKRKIPLEPHTIIARFITPHENRELGPWWITTSALERLAEQSARAGMRLGSVARDGLAVREDWSRTMQTILVYRMRVMLWAWLGRAGRQPSHANSVVGQMLSGGEYQLYVPGIWPNHVAPLGSALSYFAVPQSKLSRNNPMQTDRVNLVRFLLAQKPRQVAFAAGRERYADAES